MITLRVDNHGNKLLRLLSEDDQRLILPQVQTVQLTTRQVLYEAGDPITRLYFPNECVISLIIGWSSKVYSIIGELLVANSNQKDP